MPVHTNKIDSFEFLEMRGQPYLRQQQKELIERAGVDGSGARRIGKRGKPFSILTINYEESFQSAATKMEQYVDLCDQELVVFMRYDVPEGFVLVLEVVEVDKFAIFPSVGGIQPDPGSPVSLECCHVVSWTLLLGTE